MIEVTVGTWHEAITAGRVFNQARDTPRIRAAFVTLEQTRESWPAPKHFLDALPRVEDLPRIAKEFKPASPETVAKVRAELEAFIPDKGQPEPVKPQREGPPLSEIEAELQAHYANTGKMAAAGPDA